MQGGTVYTKLKQQMYEFKICRGHQQSWDFGNNTDPSNYNLNNHRSSSSSSSSNRGEGDLVAAGYSWPPRSYTCTFCKREFRSAQALGGHMNVHRRDRARLRQSPPPPPPPAGGCNSGCSSGQFSPLNLNLVRPNPNFGQNPNSVAPSSNCNPTLSSLLTKIPQFTNALLPPSGNNSAAFEARRCPVRNACPGQDSCANRPDTKDFIRMKDSKGVENFDLDKGCGVFKRGEVVRLELEIGLISESREELDLELRLGQN